MIWTSPGGQRYVTLPGSALLFPSLCHTAAVTATPPPRGGGGEKTAMMPTRTRTRAQARAAAITVERRATHHRRTNPTPVPANDDEHLEYDDTLPQRRNPTTLLNSYVLQII